MNTSAGRGWLNAAATVLGIGLALLLAATAVMAVQAARGAPVSFPLSPEAAFGTEAGPTLLPGVELARDATVTVRLPDPAAAQSAWSVLLWLPSTLLAGAAVTLVLLAVVRARRGDPFGGGVVTIMRTLGVVLLVGGPLVQLLTGVGSYRLAGTVLGRGADFAPAFTLDGPIVGVCVLALAEVIRHGQRLREELDEVI
ncbi:DUF2975 domain-containing protein [Isoptericola sp. b441]|uniref:DUF2975 domain-containing protein n=1 Tax=Actinotalea lenta TaxID=3064654 RepID=A0ABT9DCA8_9CELL|nr:MULTISPECIES: DUF2975 domain-containing protein [unclassified Isoptericola]MDO8107934.1 DUF2975 domain-containing protein [Isoptericola sp. b441]MDO8120399.1 DUF2975 domain-containing protein [Isoptericola sp. b490]